MSAAESRNASSSVVDGEPNSMSKEASLEKGPEKVAEPAPQLAPIPDGGWRAWSVVLGV